MKGAAGQVVETDGLARLVFDQLGLPEPAYAQSAAGSESAFRPRVNENEEALKKMLFYRALLDLRRSWRVVLPNLEQCGLLRVGYRDLDHSLARTRAGGTCPASPR